MEGWLSNAQCQQRDEPLTKGWPLNQFHLYSYHLEKKHSTVCVTLLVLSSLYWETDTAVMRYLLHCMIWRAKSIQIKTTYRAKTKQMCTISRSLFGSH